MLDAKTAGVRWQVFNEVKGRGETFWRERRKAQAFG